MTKFKSKKINKSIKIELSDLLRFYENNINLEEIKMSF